MTLASLSASSALVGSSQSTMGLSLSMARAMLTRCFSPPLSLSPRSPTIVSEPRGNRPTTSSSRDRLMASCTALSGAARLP
mmetsp:Transcript_9055/g.30873  ORF Transcript_9055/g.30873 Transcript_9055/m.30873 type:complete len:81 (+) Transcript_9055:303-545(+)